MTMTIHLSNRLETLADQLACLLEERPLAPLEPETVVIPGRGMERWLSISLARRLGICSHLRFPFPASFIDGLLSSLMPDLPPPAPFDKENLTWRIAGILEDLPPQFDGEIGRFLAGEEREIKRFQLARETADILDRCTIYRPHLLAAWERRGEGGWLGEVWRRVITLCGPWHRARKKEELRLRTERGRIAPSLLPRRIILFGISYLTPFHLDLLLSLSTLVETHLFVISPCRDFWGEDRKLRRGDPAAIDPPHPILASFGAMGREFFNRLLECPVPVQEESGYRQGDDATLLSLLQNDILDRRMGGVVTVDPGDRSIAIHVCHAPMREVEVLYDQLLHLFQEDPLLTPRDVVVMTPAMETYAPCIEAVFGSGGAIPWVIADPSTLSPPPYGAFLSTLLSLPDSRFTPPEILDILESTPVAARFGFTPSALERIRGWIRRSGILWGIDGKDRERRGLPPYREGSWEEGIERLLWGYFLEPSEGTLYDGVLPLGGIEGEHAVLLGRFVTLFRELAAIVGELRTPRTLSGWGEYLSRLLVPFAPPGVESHDYPLLIRLLGSLPEVENQSGYHSPVSREVIGRWLKERLPSIGGGGLVTGRVTFCTMLPMRSIPSRVVAVIGLNDGIFPRSDRPASFDPIARDPRPGDRSVRDEDRYIFLETILSARARLLLTYTGISQTDDAPLPPSVILSELLDYLDARFTAGEKRISETIVTRHPLHPFNPAYFTGGNVLVSHSERNLEAARALLGDPIPPPPFVPAPLPPPEGKEFTIGDLREFARNPARFFITRRLGFSPRESSRGEIRSETFIPDPGESYRLKEQLLTHLMQGRRVGEITPILRAEGLLPPGGYGERAMEKAMDEILPLLERIRKELGDHPSPHTLPVDLTIGEFRVRGEIITPLPNRIVRHPPSRLSGKQQLSLWFEHLILSAAGLPDQGESTLLVLDNEKISFPPLPADQAKEYLGKLLSLVWQGSCEPLPLFPNTSLSFAETESMELARKIWGEKGSHSHPESDDPAYTLCFGETDPLDERFQKLAQLVFVPLIRHRSILR